MNAILRAIVFGLVFAGWQVGAAIMLMDAGPTNTWGWVKLGAAVVVAFSMGVFTYKRDPEKAWGITPTQVKAAIAALAALASLTACAASQLPPGYESLKTEATMVEVSKYITGMRDAYVGAKQQQLMTTEQFTLAVKADQTVTAAWNRLVAAQKAKTDTAALWAEVIQSTTTLENLIRYWLPADLASAKPSVLGVSP